MAKLHNDNCEKGYSMRWRKGSKNVNINRLKYTMEFLIKMIYCNMLMLEEVFTESEVPLKISTRLE